MLPPLAPDGPCLTIRRFVARDVALDAFGVERRTRTGLLEAMVRAGWNLLVAGATSAGKTTLCNALARAIDADERIVTIEETAELRFRNRTSCGSKRGRRTPKASARCRCASSSEPRCGCGPTG